MANKRKLAQQEDDQQLTAISQDVVDNIDTSNADRTTGWDQAAPMLVAWCRRARESGHAHHLADQWFNALHNCLTVGVLASTACAAVTRTHVTAHEFFLAITAALVGYQTAARFATHSVEHKRAAAGFADLRREIEALSALEPGDRGKPSVAIKTTVKRYSALTNVSPSIPQRFYRETEEWAVRDKMSPVFGIDPYSASIPATTSNEEAR